MHVKQTDTCITLFTANLIQSHTHTNTHAPTHARIHTCTHAHIHPHTHTHTCARIHTRTCSRMGEPGIELLTFAGRRPVIVADLCV